MANSVPASARALPADHKPFQVEPNGASVAARSEFPGTHRMVNFDVDNDAAVGVHGRPCQRNRDDAVPHAMTDESRFESVVTSAEGDAEQGMSRCGVRIAVE